MNTINPASQFIVAIGNVVKFPVKFTLKDGAVDREFSAELECDRLAQDDVSARLAAGSNDMKTFMSGGLVKGWTGQTLIVDQTTGQPAAFSDAALDAFLGVSGVASVSFSAYIAAIGAKQKN